MKIKDLIKKDIDVEVYDNVTQEIIDISFVGPLELTEEGKEKFKEVLEYDVVLYEEGLDDDTLYRAVDFIRKADVLIVGGTSLAVYPAAGLINYYEGKKLVRVIVQ